MTTDAADEENDEEIPGIERLLALTDGVVAIALTLLVLQLQVPITHALERNPSSASNLWHGLDIDFAELTSYLVSFVVIAQFWLVHHRILRSTRGHNEGLAWRNFGFLLALTLTPFTSDLLGRYSNNPLAIMLFGLNVVAISLTTQWIFYYADHHNLLNDQIRSAHAELSGACARHPRHRHRLAVHRDRLDRREVGPVRLAPLPPRSRHGRTDRPIDRAAAESGARGVGPVGRTPTGRPSLSPTPEARERVHRPLRVLHQANTLPALRCAHHVVEIVAPAVAETGDPGQLHRVVEHRGSWRSPGPGRSRRS